jgi:hypothetical protein
MPTDWSIARNLLALLPDFWSCNSRLWRDKLGQISLATTTLFWGVSGNLRYIVLAWAAAALGYSTTQASALVRGGGHRHGRGRGGGLAADEAGPRPRASSRWASAWGCWSSC